MNQQFEIKGGKKVNNRIEWCDFSWNPIGGCQHACRWQMPDGQVAICYAEEVAEGLAQKAYADGFASHYWRPHMLKEPARVKWPARIFMDSMSDLMGSWVPEEQILEVLQVCRAVSWHTFQLLTKNPTRLLKFDLPENVWPGASSPPDFMWGKQLSRLQQEKLLHKTFEVLSQIKDRVTWVSFEPLSHDVSAIARQYPGALKWAVIGAASNGPRTFQPDPEHVQALLEVLDEQKVPIFYKGNLIWSPWREEFPATVPA